MIRSKFLIGLVAGVLISTAVHFIFFPAAEKASKEDDTAVASVATSRLTKTALQDLAKTRLAAVNSEEYRALLAAAETWTQEQLLKLEAEELGIGVDFLEKEEIHNKIKLTEDRLKLYYNNHKKKYGDDFDVAKTLVEKDLYAIAYENRKAKLLSTLRDKFDVKINLEKPVNYVLTKPEGMASGDAAVKAASVIDAAGEKDLVKKSEEIQKQLKGLPAQGPQNAPITMVEYADFHCGFCKKSHSTVQKIIKNYPEKIRYVFRHFPLSNTPGSGSFLSHEAAMCARAQNKFWEYGDEIFSFSGSPGKEDLIQIAKDLDLKQAEFKACLEEGTYRDEIQDDKASGVQRGVRGTPTFFFNDERVGGALPYNKLSQIIEEILDPSKKKIAEAVQKSADGTVTFNDLEGRISIGPSDAKITVVEFSDFHCPFCKRVQPSLDTLMSEYEGKVRRYFRHYPLPMHAGAEKTHEASECANEQGKFWEYHDKLFEKVGGYRTQSALVDLAVSVGMKREDFQSCLESGRYSERVQKDIAKGSSVGVTGTPATYINGIKVSGARPYESFKAIVDALLAGKEPPAEAPRRRQQPPPPANFEFKDLDGKPSKGNPDAPVTIVEFSDFHCPFCKRAQSSLAEVAQNYGDQVRFVFRHFPLSIHPNATRAHEASQCAFEQGKFWEFHALMFENMGAKGDAKFKEFAGQLNLDMAAFTQCLESNKYTAFVQDELKRGQEAGVRGTPAFFINGKALRGAQPYTRFKAIIDETLSQA